MNKYDNVIERLEELISVLKKDTTEDGDAYRIYFSIENVAKEARKEIIQDGVNKYLDMAGELFRYDVLVYLHDYLAEKLGKSNVSDVYEVENSLVTHYTFSIYIKKYNLYIMDIYSNGTKLSYRKKYSPISMKNLGITLDKIRKRRINDILGLNPKAAITEDSYNKYLDIRSKSIDYVKPYTVHILDSLDKICDEIYKLVGGKI